MPPVHSIFVV